MRHLLEAGTSINFRPNIRKRCNLAQPRRIIMERQEDCNQLELQRMR